MNPNRTSNQHRLHANLAVQLTQRKDRIKNAQMHKEVREIPLVRRLQRNITFEVAKAPNSSLIHKISEMQNSQILIFILNANSILLHDGYMWLIAWSLYDQNMIAIDVGLLMRKEVVH